MQTATSTQYARALVLFLGAAIATAFLHFSPSPPRALTSVTSATQRFRVAALSTTPRRPFASATARSMRTTLHDETSETRPRPTPQDNDDAASSRSSSSSSNSKGISTRRPRSQQDHEYERPKAQKPMSSSSLASMTQTVARQKQKEMGELEVVGASLALLVARALDPFLNPAPVQNYALLICDIALLITFRTVEDMVLTPFPTIDVVASPDLIKNGLLAYADPFAAASHIASVTTDGLTLGCFWLAAVMLGRAQAVERDVGSSYALSTWATFRTWYSLVNLRLGVLFLQALSIQEGVDLQHFQSEMSAVLVTMLCWRWLNVSIGKAFF